MPFKPGEIPEGAKPFSKGETGNPNGRPPDVDLKSLLSKYDGDLDGVVEALVNQAKKGNIKAIQELFDRKFGKVPQNIGLSGQLKTIVEPVKLTDEQFKEALEAIKPK